MIDSPINFAEVSIQKVFNFESSSRSTVPLKSVQISNGEQNIELKELGLGDFRAEFNNSTYSLASSLGHKLTVVDLKGNLYESKIVYKHNVPRPDSLQIATSTNTQTDSLGQNTNINLASVHISTPILPQENNALMWEVSQIFQVSTTQPRKCYITESPVKDEVLFLDTRTLTLNQVDKLQLLEVPITKKFREGIYFSVRQYSIDEPTLEHLSNIRSLLTEPKTIFTNPLNKLSSNIRNITNIEDEALGHFYISQAVDVRIKYDSIRTYCHRPPPFGTDDFGDCVSDGLTGCAAPGTNSDPLCCDCRKVEGSSTQKPTWWK